MKTFEFPTERVLLGRLERGDDLLEALTDLCRRQGVSAGTVQAIGAVEHAAIGFYDQRAGRYESISLLEELEIASLLGNVSLKDGEPLVHAHVVLADATGLCRGGHLLPGTSVFACEFTLRVLEGPALERTLDEATGLPLW